MRALTVAALAALGLAAAAAPASGRACLAPGARPVSEAEAVALAKRAPEGRGAPDVADARFYCDSWRVRLARDGRIEAELEIDGRDGRVREAFAGHDARWPMARGSGELFVGPWAAPIMVALALAFAGILGRGRLLDVAALLALCAPLVPFAFGVVELSTPLVAASLAALLVRLTAIARGRASPHTRPTRLTPTQLIAAAGILLLGRAFYTALVGGASDVGYLSVFGAQAILDGFPVYAATGVQLDAYGPFTHLAYVPFAALFPLPGGLERGGDEAARAASITFDFLTAAVLYATGRRLGSHGLGAILAFAWAASPLAFLQVATSTNDGLVGLLLAAAILTLASPVGRGIATGLAAAAKWVPFVLAPLLAAGTRRLDRETAVRFAFGFAASAGAAMLALMPDGGPREMYDVALGDIAQLDSPFSVWGLWSLPEALRLCAFAVAGAFAVVTAFVPAERDAVTVAALCAAVVIAVQLTLPYWAFAYAVWFLPCALVAIFARSEPLNHGLVARER